MTVTNVAHIIGAVVIEWDYTLRVIAGAKHVRYALVSRGVRDVTTIHRRGWPGAHADR